MGYNSVVAGMTISIVRIISIRPIISVRVKVHGSRMA